MKALTVRQPFGWAIFHGKGIENRRAKINHQGTLLIHTGQQLARAQDFAFVNHLADEPLPALGQPGEPTECAVGAIIGAVQVFGEHHIDACGGTCSSWADKNSPVHIRIGEPRVFRFPIPAYGRLGLWEVMDPIVDLEVRTELARAGVSA